MMATKLIAGLAQAISDFGDLEVTIERDGPTVYQIGRKDECIILYVKDRFSAAAQTSADKEGQ